MATPKEKRPTSLEEAVAQLKRDSSHSVRVNVEDLEVELRVVGSESDSKQGIAMSAGGWGDLIDCEAFERDVYERRHRPRSPVGGL